MSHQWEEAPDSRERRLREIESELAALRREQRLFRRVGFSENLKAMQVVTLQMEMREHLRRLPAGMVERYSESGLVRARVMIRRGIEKAAIALTVVLMVIRALSAPSSRPRVARRAIATRLVNALAVAAAHGQRLE